MSFAPTTFYDILPNDYLNMALTGQVVDNKSCMGMVPGGSYPFPAPAEGLVLPTYPTYSEVPLFQSTPPSFPSTSGVASPASWEDALSQSSSSSLLQTPPPLPSTSNFEFPTWDPSWSQSSADPGPFCFPPISSLPYPIPTSGYPPCSSQSSATPPLDLSQLYPESGEPDSKPGEEEEPRKLTGPQRRKKVRASRHHDAGLPYKRPPGTSYSALMAALPEDLQEKVKSEYKCCKGIDKKDKSTKMKHWFTNNHFRTAVGDELFYLQPMFVCPAFIAMMGGCRSAKGGRVDSSERHCGSCESFRYFVQECRADGMTPSPILLNRGEFEAIRDFRKQLPQGQRCYSPQVQNAVFELLKMMVTSKVPVQGKGKGKAE